VAQNKGNFFFAQHKNKELSLNINTEWSAALMLALDEPFQLFHDVQKIERLEGLNNYAHSAE
jgi:hypothetical protein